MERHNAEPAFTEIPGILFSSDTGKPFSNCMVCNKLLLNDDTPYMIEKAMKRHTEVGIEEVIFEYALCMDCAVKMNASLSEESRERISEYFSKHSNFEERRAKLMSDPSVTVNAWISDCLFKKSSIQSTGEYQIVAQCVGSHLLLTDMPFAISMEAMDEITSLLSEKSLGEIDDFMGKYFTGPPEVAAILKRRVVLL